MPGKTKDIEFRKSFFRFSFVFFFCLIFGWVGRYILYTQPLGEMISQKISQNKNYKVDLGHVQLKLSRGWLPALSLFIDKATILDNNCLSRSVKLEEVHLSLNIFKLLQKEVEPRSLVVDQLKLVTADHCGKKQEIKQGSGVAKKASPPQAFAKPSPFQPSDLFSFFEDKDLFAKIPSVNIYQLHINFIKNGESEIETMGEFVFKKTKDQLKAHFYPEKVEFQGQELPVSRGALELSMAQDKAELQYKSFIREGEVQAKVQLKKEGGDPLEIFMQAKKIPISTFSRLFLTKTPLNYLWVNCQLNFSASWEHWKKTPFSLQECHLSGPYGTARVGQSELTFEEIKKLEVEFNKINLDQVIKDKRGVYFSGIFSKYGNLSGELKRFKGQWKLKALLENSHFIFSRNNLREKQKVMALPFQVVSNNKGWELKASQLKIDAGEIKGKVEISVDKSLKNGQGLLHLRQVRLDPKVYKLMLGSQASDFSVFGKVHLDQGVISNWSGALTANQLKGDGFSISLLKIVAREGKAKTPLLHITSSQGEFAVDTQFFNWLKPTVFDEEFAKAPLVFKEMSVKLSPQKNNSWLWKRGYLRLSNQWQLSSEGEKRGREGVRSWLQWDIPKKEVVRWSYEGPFLKGKWKPEKEWMKDWLRTNKEHLAKHPSVDFVDDKKNKVSENVKTMGKKLLEKAKNVLPIKVKKESDKGS